MFYKIGALKNLTNFTGKHMFWGHLPLGIHSWNKNDLNDAMGYNVQPLNVNNSTTLTSLSLFK